jgi:hypothetical protein
MPGPRNQIPYTCASIQHFCKQMVPPVALVLSPIAIEASRPHFARRLIIELRLVARASYSTPDLGPRLRNPEKRRSQKRLVPPGGHDLVICFGWHVGHPPRTRAIRVHDPEKHALARAYLALHGIHRTQERRWSPAVMTNWHSSSRDGFILGVRFIVSCSPLKTCRPGRR